MTNPFNVEREAALRAGRMMHVSDVQSEVASVQEARALVPPYPDVADSAVAAEMAAQGIRTGMLNRTLVDARDLREPEPGYRHYPRLIKSFYVMQGIDLPNVNVPNCRAIVIGQNGSNFGCWVPELSAVVPNNPAMNLTTVHEQLSFIWSNFQAPFPNRNGIVTGDGLWMYVQCFDEWLPGVSVYL